ncbi:hypothetical protein HYZ97_00130 [Candidatus Pacearchaeota archaeon]|nr:hypothetical protein [Candidatus Pacearchaeota archaeon]
MEDIIWQPKFCTGYDIAIFLDKEYAKEALESMASEEKKARLNELGNEELIRRGINWLEPYQFHATSCLLTTVNIGQGGIWLNADNNSIRNLEESSNKSLEYHSHNVHSMGEAFALMSLFDMWARYAILLK